MRKLEQLARQRELARARGDWPAVEDFRRAWERERMRQEQERRQLGFPPSPLQCEHCGAEFNTTDGDWRCTGKSWEHTCPASVAATAEAGTGCAAVAVGAGVVLGGCFAVCVVLTHLAASLLH